MLLFKNSGSESAGCTKECEVCNCALLLASRHMYMTGLYVLVLRSTPYDQLQLLAGTGQCKVIIAAD